MYGIDLNYLLTVAVTVAFLVFLLTRGREFWEGLDLPKFLAIILVVGFLCVDGYFIAYKPKLEPEILQFVLVLPQIVMLVAGYIWGSSSSSKAKDETNQKLNQQLLEKISPPVTPPTPPQQKVPLSADEAARLDTLEKNKAAGMVLTADEAAEYDRLNARR